MKWNRLAFFAAIAASLGLSSAANASFNYSTSLTITSVVGSGGTIVNTPGTGAIFTSVGGTVVTLGDVTRTGFAVPSDNTINIGDVTVTTVAGSPGDTFSVFYTDTFTLTNVPPPGTAAVQSFNVHGRLDLTGVSTGSGTVSNTYLPPSSGSFMLGGVQFTGAADNFGNPTINGRSGNLGGTLSAEAVPEPSSIALIGIGSLGVVGFGLRRRKAQ